MDINETIKEIKISAELLNCATDNVNESTNCICDLVSDELIEKYLTEVVHETIKALQKLVN